MGLTAKRKEVFAKYTKLGVGLATWLTQRTSRLKVKASCRDLTAKRREVFAKYASWV